MIFEYVKGFIFVIVFISFMYVFGKSIHQSKNFSENFLIGYVCYTCLQFCIGFICQQFRLPWLLYQVFMIGLIIFIIYYVFYKKKIKIAYQNLLLHFQEYWLLYFLVMVLIFLALMNVDYLWNGNHTDDGYYLSKIRMAPYVSSYVDYNYATGFTAPGSIVRNLNTFEIEAAFYCQILGMEATIYAKVFLSAIHYMILLNTIYWFFHTVYMGNKKNLLIYALVPILFFGIYQEMMLEKHFIVMSDAWQFNSAMWFGSTLVRTAGFFLMMTPLLKENLYFKEKSILLSIITIALLSKSSQTLPLVFLVCVSYVLSKMMVFYLKHKNVKFLIGIIFFIIMSIMIPLSNVNDEGIRTLLSDNKYSYLLILSFLIVIGSLFFGNEKMKQWSLWLLIIGALIFIPRMNKLFLIISIYDFVAERMVTLYFFTIIMSASFFIFVYLSRYIKHHFIYYIIYSVVGCICIYYPMRYIQKNHGLKFSVNILLKHNHLIPNATMDLGNALQELYLEYEKPMYVLSPMWFKNYNIPHSPATSLRYNAFDIYSIGACGRYEEIDEGLEFESYTSEEQQIFDMYNSGEYRNNEVLKTVLDRFPINCIIVTYEEAAQSLEELGFRTARNVKLDDTFTYYILFKE